LTFDGRLACPKCQSDLGTLSAQMQAAACERCGNHYSCIDGIWRFLPPDRLAVLEPFLRDYTAIRLAEGRGSKSPDFYLKLPSCDPGHPIAWQWAIHKNTFDCFVRRVLPKLGRNPSILDLGAGVAWLSRRLAEHGCTPCAIDVSVDDQDGLGAARHYTPAWPRFQAEFEHLPLASGVADAVIYNASLHYSTDYGATLREALRVLRPGGSIVVLETPVYQKEESGKLMIAERHAFFEKRYGTRSESIPSLQYMTRDRLTQLEHELCLNWEKVEPWYGWKWAMRPWVARWKGKREPSRFVILIGRQ